MPNLVSADTLARQGGVKLLVYGPAGTAKTPLCATAPKPVLLSVEAGNRSLEGHTFMAEHTREVAKILDFFRWVKGAKEAQQFDTICIDSLSEVGEVILVDELRKNKDGRAAYGRMGEIVVAIVQELLENKRHHIYIIAKLDPKQIGNGGRREPYFPGNPLSVYVPHAVDEIYYIDRQVLAGRVPNAPIGEHLCFQTFTDQVTHARSRSGKVDPFEPPHLGRLFEKITSRSKQ